MPKTAAAPLDLDNDTGESLDRIISFCDGIFAFSMTLLAINVDLPSLEPGASVAEVTQQVLDLAPQFVVFATTFLLVALYWHVHHRMFRYIKRYDTPLIWLNVFQMLFVAFLPVAAGLFDTYPHVPIVIAVYGSTLALIGLFGSLWWRHASGAAQLLNASASHILISYYNFRGYVTFSIYVALILMAFIAPEYADWVFLIFVPVYPFLQAIFRQYWRRRQPKAEV